MRDFIFKPELDERGYVDRTRLKRELASFLGDRMVDGRARYLFSCEPLLSDVGQWFRLRVTEGEGVPGMPEIPVTPCEDGIEVSLAAWVALDRSMFRAGEPEAALAIRCRERLQRMCVEKFGRALDISAIDIGARIRVMSAHSKGSKLTRPYGRISVSGIVRSRDEIEEIQRNGIGEARAYGFGLVASQNMN